MPFCIPIVMRKSSRCPAFMLALLLAFFFFFGIETLFVILIGM